MRRSLKWNGTPSAYIFLYDGSGRYCHVTDSGHAQTSPQAEEDAENRPSLGYDKPRQTGRI
jgi:hypothetical protein